MKYAIMVVFDGCEPQYVRDGVCGGTISTFASKKKADEYAAFISEGMDDAKVSVVPAPKRKVLLFVQTGDARPKCVYRLLANLPWDALAEAIGDARDDGARGDTLAELAARADRWWLVECENADEGRTIIGCCPLDDHRILASGGRHA